MNHNGDFGPDFLLSDEVGGTGGIKLAVIIAVTGVVDNSIGLVELSPEQQEFQKWLQENSEYAEKYKLSEKIIIDGKNVTISTKTGTIILVCNNWNNPFEKFGDLNEGDNFKKVGEIFSALGMQINLDELISRNDIISFDGEEMSSFFYNVLGVGYQTTFWGKYKNKNIGVNLTSSGLQVIVSDLM